MSKRTLSQLTQDILDSMDSDNVNSINDTEEALQVASLLRRTHDEIISQKTNWPHLRELAQLTSSGNSNKPTHMSLGDSYVHLEWIKYNKRKSTDTKDKYEDVKYLIPSEFLDILNARDSSDSTVDSVTDDNNATLLIKNDRAPSYWTSFDDENIVFDSYDSDVDTTLQTSKTQALVYKETSWTVDDNFTPDLPAEMFPYLLAEATSVAWNEIKQAANAKEEQKARRQRAKNSRAAWKYAGGVVNKINYGRN